MSTNAPLDLAVLGASGGTGLELTRQALDRGHSVVAIARRPDRIAVPDSPRLTRRRGDVRDPDGIAEALRAHDVVQSGRGVARGDRPGVLTAGARAAIAAHPARIVWLGAFGTGPSVRAAGPFTAALLRLVLRAELDDKVAADALVLEAGGVVMHAGPLTGRALSPNRRTVGLADAPRRLFPASVGRATVAAAMLDAAEQQQAGVLIPLER